MSVADDEQRLIEAVRRAATRTNTGRLSQLGYTEQLIADMRAEGITLTPPPAPEPTYTVRLTEAERVYVCDALFQYLYDEQGRMVNKDVAALHDRIAGTHPDEVTP